MTKRKSKPNGLITASGRSITKRELKQIEEMVFSNLGSYMAEEKFQELMTPPPPHAIQIREDGYPYLKHGYVRFKVIEIFGMDWDFEILPVYSGEPYRLIPEDKAMKSPPGIMTFGRLTLRLNPLDAKGSPMWNEPIIKIISGSGTANWRKKMPLGKVVNAAESSTFRRCAMPLGPALGLTLYWNDEEMIQKHENRNKPQTLAQLWDMISLSPFEAAEKLDVEINNIVKQFESNPDQIWEVLKEYQK